MKNASVEAVRQEEKTSRETEAANEKAPVETGAF
jgi:hypothetical protein